MKRARFTNASYIIVGTSILTSFLKDWRPSFEVAATKKRSKAFVKIACDNGFTIRIERSVRACGRTCTREDGHCKNIPKRIRTKVGSLTSKEKCNQYVGSRCSCRSFQSKEILLICISVFHTWIDCLACLKRSVYQYYLIHNWSPVKHNHSRPEWTRE